MGEHRVDLARLRGEIALRQRAVRIVAADFRQKPLEFLDVAVDSLAEGVVGAIAPANFVVGLLALRGVEAAAEDVPLAAPEAIPEFDNRIVIEQARNIERQRIDGIDGAVRLTRCLLARRRLLTLFA